MVLQPSRLPSGTVTFLFSDIEGSTARWERYPVAMQDALRRHDRLMRDAIETHGGRVFKTLGDAFCAVFAGSDDALEAAVEAQRKLTAEDFSAVDGLRVRMALHAGTTDERDSDYFGPAVNRVARLLSTAHGGQVLMSSTVADNVQYALRSTMALRDLGVHRLKDLVQPEHVFQIVAPDIPAEFAPLQSLSVLSNNLPQQLTNLIGRECEVSEIQALVRQHRLVTLTGAGGVGKTRVALQVGADLLDGSGDGVWFIDLAPLNDPSLVARSIASAVGQVERADTPVLETLLQYLKSRRLLLVLDNCEHVVNEVARVGNAILSECPEVKIIATSREPLHITGEHIYPIQSLAVPPERSVLSAEDALRYSAVALFVERAAASDPTFRITDESAPVVGEICRRIDGIALAIELAAARVRVLAPRQLAKKLDDRLRVLTGGMRTALPRQQTMRALIDWSYELLSEKERTLFRRLSVFAGGWNLETACDVCAGEAFGGETIEDVEVFDLLSALVDKSLVVAEPSTEDERYRLLESTRDYARERLQTPEREVTSRKHAMWFLSFADSASVANIQLELDNIRVALEWSLIQGHDVNLGGALACKLTRFWRLRPREGRVWLDAAQERIDPALEPRLAAGILSALASVMPRGVERRRLLAQAVRAYRDVDDDVNLAQALRQFGDELSFSNHFEEAEVALSEALEISRRHSDRETMARCLSLLATVHSNRGDIDPARDLYRQALDLHAPFQAAQSRAHANILGNWAELEFTAGELERSIELQKWALEVEGQAESPEAALSNCNLAAYSIHADRFEDADAYAREAIAKLRDGQEPYYLALAVEHLAVIAGLRGDVHRAILLFGYSDSRVKSLGIERQRTEQLGYERLLGALAKHVHDDELARRMSEGAALSDERAIAIALEPE